MTAEPDLEDDRALLEHLEQAVRIAVIGMKRSGAARSIPKYLVKRGYEVVPVNPKFDRLAGEPAYDRVDEIDHPIDIVDLFRRPESLPAHVDEILAMEPLPKLVWFQLGISNDQAAERLADHGIDVIQDKCIKVEHRRLIG